MRLAVGRESDIAWIDRLAVVCPMSSQRSHSGIIVAEEPASGSCAAPITKLPTTILDWIAVLVRLIEYNKSLSCEAASRIVSILVNAVLVETKPRGKP